MSAPGERVGLIRNVRVPGPWPDELYDLVLRHGLIDTRTPAGTAAPGGENAGQTLDGDGCWAIPGLWDHHVHVTPWALRTSRTSLAAARSAQEAAALMGASAPDASGLRVGVEFRDGLWPTPPSLAVLDAATGEVPTYLVNADLHSVWLNSAALRREHLGAVPDGVLREGPAFDVATRLNEVGDHRTDAAVQAAGRAAAARGVVGVVDLDMTWNASAWQRRIDAGFDHHRVRFGLYPQHLERAVTERLRSGDLLETDRPSARGLVQVGGLKVITDGSLGTRTAACRHPYGPDGGTGLLPVSAADLTALLGRATDAGLDVYVHAIGDRALGNALTAFQRTRARGTLEHVQLASRADIARLAALGVRASLQPTHAVDDRDLADREWGALPDDTLVYPMASLARAGVPLVLGSDAPVADLDPWRTLANAVRRSDDERPAWHGEEALELAVALAASTAGGTRSPSTLAPGARADIALVEHDPTTADDAQLRGMVVRATLVGARLTHLA